MYEHNKNILVEKGFSSKQIALNNLDMQLRKCCNHPFLIREIEEEYSKKYQNEEEKIKMILQASGKMTLVNKLLDKFKSEGKKVLIFTQFRGIIKLIEELLISRDTKYEKLDGSVRAGDRQNSIDRYNDLDKKR